MARRRQLSLFPFDDREHAGRVLARDLQTALQGDPDAVVVGLARGGIVVAASVARALGLPLEAVAVRKVSHPLQPEHALGAVTAGGPRYLCAHNGLAQAELVIAIATAHSEARALERTLHRDRPPLSLLGRTAVLVDDGLATGATMIAAARWARGLRVRRVVAVAPVGARQTVELLRSEVDEVVCPYVVDQLGSVGLWYADFSAVGDEEVLELLDAAQAGDLDDRVGRSHEAVPALTSRYQ